MLAEILLGVVGGWTLAWLHLRTLRPSVDWLMGGQTGRAIGLQLARFALVTLALLGLALVGAPALIAAAVTLLLGRNAMMKHMAGEDR